MNARQLTFIFCYGPEQLALLAGSLVPYFAPQIRPLRAIKTSADQLIRTNQCGSGYEVAIKGKSSSVAQYFLTCALHNLVVTQNYIVRVIDLNAYEAVDNFNPLNS